MASLARSLAAPTRARRLVLFDIDGTILWTDGAGRRAVFRALEEHFGRIGPDDHRFDGKTDPQIVRELLDALEALDDVVLGLLTGNIQPGAHAKLAAVGIAPERFVVGAFGSDHHDRPELPEIARRRAEQVLGHPVRGGDVVVIGDTPADVACGIGIGARAIGVATGRYSVEELRACAPAAVFADLRDTAAVVRAILDD